MTKSGKTKNKVKEYERPKEVVKSAKTESASECLFDVEGEWPSRHDSMADAIGVSMEGHDIAEKGPLKVIIHVYLADLPCVDTIAFTFRPKMQLTLDWVDDGALVDENIPILDEDGGTSSASSANYWTGGFSIRPDLVDKPSESMFNPKLILVNSIADATPSVDKSISLALLRGRPVVYEYCEFFPVLRSPLDLAQFPFDTSTLECRFTSNDWSTSDLQFVWAKEMQDFNKTVSPSARGGPGLSEFEIIGLETAIEGFSYSQQDRYEAQSCEYPHAILRITVRRDPFSYLMRVAVVSVMLMLMEVVSFLVDAKDLGGRFSVSGTTFLAMVAFYYCVVDMLPKVSTITRCDKWNICNFALMFCSNIENLLAYGALKLEVVTEKELEWFEHRMAVLYFMSVLGLLVWFLWPLMERMKERASMSGSAVSSGGVPSQGKDKDKEEDNDKKNGKGKGKDKAE